MYMADKIILIFSREAIEVSDIKKTIFYIRVNGKVADTKRSQVLKEMGPLARVNTIVFET